MTEYPKEYLDYICKKLQIFNEPITEKTLTESIMFIEKTIEINKGKEVNCLFVDIGIYNYIAHKYQPECFKDSPYPQLY